MDNMAKTLSALKKALKKVSDKGGVRLAGEVSDVREALNAFLNAVGETIKSYEAAAQEEADEEALARMNYDLTHRRLLGVIEEIRPLARKCPDAKCNAYKLQQVNRVLRLLKEELDACFGSEMELADEDAGLSYSDLSFLLRGFQDLSSAYARQRYHLIYAENGK